MVSILAVRCMPPFLAVRCMHPLQANHKPAGKGPGFHTQPSHFTMEAHAHKFMAPRDNRRNDVEKAELDAVTHRRAEHDICISPESPQDFGKGNIGEWLAKRNTRRHCVDWPGLEPGSALWQRCQYTTRLHNKSYALHLAYVQLACLRPRHKLPLNPKKTWACEGAGITKRQDKCENTDVAS